MVPFPICAHLTFFFPLSDFFLYPPLHRWKTYESRDSKYLLFLSKLQSQNLSLSGIIYTPNTKIYQLMKNSMNGAYFIALRNFT